jgi:hypothetical protein
MAPRQDAGRARRDRRPRALGSPAARAGIAGRARWDRRSIALVDEIL